MRVRWFGVAAAVAAVTLSMTTAGAQVGSQLPPSPTVTTTIGGGGGGTTTTVAPSETTTTVAVAGGGAEVQPQVLGAEFERSAPGAPQVLGTTQARAGGLAVTGADVIGLAVFAAGLALLGTILVRAARRRPRSD